MTKQEMLTVIEKGIKNEGVLDMVTLLNAKNSILEDIRVEANKKSGNAKQDKLIAKLIKSAEKNNPVLAGYHKQDNLFAFTDGYRAYFTNKDFGFKPAEAQRKLQQCVPEDYAHTISIDKVEIKVSIAENKAKKENQPYIVEYENIRIGFNPTYLLEILEMYNTNDIQIVSDLKKIPVSPCLVGERDNEFGILLPVRIKQ